MSSLPYNLLVAPTGRTVNDNVMGGRSRGSSVLDNGTLVFSGVTNTNGGGFSSVLIRLNPQSLVGYNRVLLRAKSDGREFRLIFPDNRQGSVVHRAEIPFDKDKNWQNVSVSFEELIPTIFGEPVNADRFEPGYTNSIGLIVNDGQDGSFNLQVDWIKICK
ncbi:MAG: CIA30 family protein [Cyanobacteria bacterium P01_G01_bin.39]